MPNFKGGVEEVLKALKLMTQREREALLSNMAKQDPAMVELLRSRLYSLEDLRFITPKMLVDFLRRIDLVTFAMALKLEDPSLRDYFYENISASMRQDIDDVINGPKHRISDVEEAQRLTLHLINSMIESGSLVISKNDDYV